MSEVMAPSSESQPQPQFQSQSQDPTPSSTTNPFTRRFILLPSTAYRLSRIDTSHIKHPRYRNANWDYIVWNLTFKGFRNQITDHNPGLPIARGEMDALWIKLLLRYFRTWDLTEIEKTRAEKRENHASWMRMQLGVAMKHRMGRTTKHQKVYDGADAWWAKYALKYPGLDITPNPEIEEEGNAEEKSEDEDYEWDGEEGEEEEEEEDDERGVMMDVDTEMMDEGEDGPVEGEVPTLGFTPLAFRPR